MTRYDLWWLIQPSHLMLWGLTLGAMLSLRPRWRRVGRRLGASALLLMLVCALTPVSDWVIGPLERRFPPPPIDAPPPCGLVVLAGAEQVSLSVKHGTPHVNDFADRLTTFVVLARRFPEATLIHSGAGSWRDGASQSTVARSFLQAALPERNIVYEDRSTNTQGAAREVARLMAANPEAKGCDWWLVTSAFHMPRSIGVFRAVGVPVAGFPTDFRTGSDGFTLPQAARSLTQLDWAAHEWVGLLWYRLRGDTRELFPKPAPSTTNDRKQ
ncbi:MAG: YdcF family protein [Pseudomonadota bacterium]